MTGPEIGIAAFGAYLPSFRLSREEIADAHKWVNPGLRSLARSERSVCGWDEDAITMAVEAGRNCLIAADRSEIARLFFASTTLPYADHLNAAVVAGALGLDEQVGATDVTGSLRAGTSAMLTAFDAAAAGGQPALCVAADRRAAAATTAQELTFGHGAAALVIAPGPGVARLLGRASLTVDFIDHFRATGREFDYPWEDRWVREEGYLKLVPKLASVTLERAGVAPGDVAAFCLPTTARNLDRAVAKRIGLPENSVQDQLAAGCGDSGAPHPLLLLVHALERAEPGDLILVIGFGQGGDALLLQAGDALPEYRSHGTGVSGWLPRRIACSYPRYLVLNDMVKVDRGMRAETDKSSGLTAAWRHRDLLLTLSGGHCEACGTYQLPRMKICVNPDCRGVETQAPHSFADSTGQIASWSADNLIYTPDPPAYYGIIDFEEGGRLMMDFADVQPDRVEVGTPMRMVFRVKDYDTVRGFTRYFWKARPTAEAA
jgi:3-hydroxy-3-methylglutaryl CoA synthase